MFLCYFIRYWFSTKSFVFIRFNPDDYEENEIIIKSCWSINKKGICVIKNSKEWSQRLNALKE